MIKEDYVDFEIAQILNSLGFDDDNVETYYVIKDCYDGYDNPTYYKVGDFVDSPYGLCRNEIIKCPSLYDAQQYLMKKHNIYVTPTQETKLKDSLPIWVDFNCEIKIFFPLDNDLCTYYLDNDYSTYREALSKGIKLALNLLCN